MTRLNVLLLLALIASSLYLVKVAYDVRRYFTAENQAQKDAQSLKNEFELLKTEQQSQGTPRLVEKAAREKLAMRTASPNVTRYVTLGASAPAAPPAAGDVR
jgi:cell division protein FtsL